MKFKLESTKGRARFSASSWFNKLIGTPVLVIGAGGIGSWATMFLAKIGCEIHLFDNDAYNINNLGGQLIPYRYINENKAEAMRAFIDSMLGVNENDKSYVEAYDQLYDAGTDSQPIVLCCVDNMDARKAAYEAWLKQEDREIFIDGRMGAEQFELYTATKDNDDYLKSWFPQSEAATLPCAYKATAHVGAAIAGAMIQTLTNYYSGHDVPKSAEYQGPLFNLEVDYV